MNTGMKILMIIVRSERREELEIFLNKEGIRGFTEIPDVFGRGTTGARMGSAVHPETSSIILAIVESEKVREIAMRIRAYCSECHEHLKLLHWDITVEEEAETV